MNRILSIAALSWLLVSATMAAQPNVVYMMADDLGWSDLSTHPGGTIKTPNIDQLFKQGVELNNFMGWCVCSPTRAMLLTGRHPYRVGTGPETGGELEKAETTIAEGFKANGYRTGIFGKWHNGEDPDTPEYRAAFVEAFKAIPNKQPKGGVGVNEHGFDEAWVYYGGGADFFTRRTVGGKGPVSWWHNRDYRERDEGYTEDFITQHAVEFIRDHKEHPFFCYIPFHIVHAPLQAKDADLKGVDAAVTDETKRTYAAMVQAMDRNVATILAELDKLGLRDNTIVVFTTDNGATLNGSNLPFRGGKHSMYEGGTHLPTVMHWPKGGVANRSWDGLCGALDMLPTLMSMADLKMPETRPLDGKNIWPALRDNTASPVESYYWSWHDSDVIRTDKWKLHRYFNRFELYDITKDEPEANNVADANADVVKSLAAKMDAWAESLGAALSHQPAPVKYHQPAAPEGEVLAVTVTITEEAKPKDRLAVSLANWNGTQYATDWIEYDIAFSPNTPKRHPYFSTLEGNNSKPFGPLFKPGTGVDQFGRDQSTGPGIADSKAVWEHRIVGLASTAPGPIGKQGVVFTGGKAGTSTIYLDNIRIRHADGTTTPLWSGSKDTRSGAFKANELFKDLKVRAVDVVEAGKL